MRKTSVWVLCGLMGLTTAAFAAAQTDSTGAMGTESGTAGSTSGSMSGGSMSHSSTAKKKSTKHHKTATSRSATGDVTVADSAAKTFSVKGKGKAGDKNFLWSDSTKFSPTGKTGADIAVGSNVTVWYNPTLTVVPMPATKVRFNTPKAAAAAKTP